MVKIEIEFDDDEELMKWLKPNYFLRGKLVITHQVNTSPTVVVPDPSSMTYIEPIDWPSFSSPQIIATGDVGDGRSIFTANLGGKRQILIRGPWNTGITLNGISGSRGADLEFMNEDSTTQAGLASDNAHHGLSVINVVNFVKVLGKNKNSAYKVSAGDGQSGLVFLPIQTASNRGLVRRFYNVQGKDIGYSMVLESSGVVGYEYKTVADLFLKCKGLSTEGEGGYYGHDNPAVQSRHRILVCIHHAFMDRGREGEQWRYIDLLISFNRTVRNVGRVAGQPGQHNLSQTQDTNGFDYFFLEDGAPILENIITHGITRQFGFSRYDGGASSAGYIGVANDHFAGSPRLNASYVAGVKKIVLRDRIIYADAAAPYAYLIEETDCDIDFINIILTDNITTLYSDNRAGGHANIITVTNVTYVPKASIPVPTYMSDDVDSKDFCKVTSSFHYLLGLGAYTPHLGNKVLVDVFEIADIAVALGTAFGSNGTGVGLSQTGQFTLSNGVFQTLNISWAIGSYDSGTPGTYSVVGTPTGLPAGVVDTYSIRMEGIVTVNGPPSVLIGLGDTAGTYTATGNWNHIFQSFSTGVQTIKGDSSSQTLASLRNTDGTLMGFQLNIVTQFQGDAKGENTNGLYPAIRNSQGWSNPGSLGTGRHFKITGLTVAHTYLVKILCSVDGAFGATQLADIVVTGGTTSTNNGFDEKDNVNNLVGGGSGISMAPNGSGEIDINVIRNTGTAQICVVEIAQL